MILDLTLNSDEISSTDDSSTTEMGVSANAAQIFFRMFTKNTYSNPIGSVVREITSNCFDSHIEANVTKPILIKRGVDAHTKIDYISFIDFGIGMSPERIKKVYNVLFTSTKQSDNTQIGGFGLGSKSPLAYYRQVGDRSSDQDNSFFVTTIFDHKKYTYCIYEGPKTPLINLLHVEDCTEGNGTEVRIPVLSKDMYRFKTEIVKQLYYFDSIVFEGFDDYSGITNEFNIVRGTSFLYRGTSYSDYMHICLGKVAYPINYDTLGLNSSEYRFPVAIKLEIGDINVVTSREAIDYSENTIKLIIKKLKEAKAEIVALIAKQYDTVVSLPDYFNFKKEFGMLYFPNDIQMNISNMCKFKDIELPNFKYSDVPVINDVKMFNNLYTIGVYGKKESRHSWKDSIFDGSYDKLDLGNVFLVDSFYKRKVLKHAYLKSMNSRNYFVSPNPLAKSAHILAEIFDVKRSELMTVNKDDARDIMFTPLYMTICEMLDEYREIVESKISTYDDIIVPSTFVREKSYTADKEDITITMVYRYNNVEKYTFKFTQLLKFKGTIIYGDFDKVLDLKNACDTYEDLFSPRSEAVRKYSRHEGFYSDNSKARVMFLMVSKANMRRIKQLKNICHVDDIYNRFFYRKKELVERSFFVGKIANRYNELDSFYRSEDFKQIFPEIGKDLTELTDYLRVNNVKQLFKTTQTLKLERYFKIDKDKVPVGHEKHFKTINNIDDICAKYKHVFKFINIPYNYGSNQEFTDFMKTVIKL